MYIHMRAPFLFISMPIILGASAPLSLIVTDNPQIHLHTSRFALQREVSASTPVYHGWVIDDEVRIDHTCLVDATELAPDSEVVCWLQLWQHERLRVGCRSRAGGKESHDRSWAPRADHRPLRYPSELAILSG